MDRQDLEKKKQDILDIFKQNVIEDEELKRKDAENHILRVYPEDSLDKTIKTIANDTTDTQSAIHNLSMDTLYSLGVPMANDIYFNLDVIGSDEVLKLNAGYDKYIDDYIQELEDTLKLDLTNVSYEDLNQLIVAFNSTFVKKYVYVIRPNALDLYDKTSREREIFNNAERIARLQLNEIKNTGYLGNKFLTTNLDKLDRPFTYYMDIKHLKIAQQKLKTLKNDLSKDNIYNLFNNEIEDESFNTTLEILNIETLGKIEFNEIELVQQKVVENFLYLTLLNLEIKEHYIKVNNIVNNNKEHFKARHQKIDLINTLTHQVIDVFSKAKEKLDNKNIAPIVDISKANNTIATGYTFIDNRLQKELEKLQDKTNNPLDLKLDYQATYKGKGHKKKPVSTPIIVAVDINNNMDIQGGGFSAFDKWVLNRVFSLWQVNKTHLSPELIYKDFINKDVDMTQMGTDIYNAIVNSIEKLRTSTMSFIFQDPATIKRLGLSSDEIEFIGKNRYILPLDKSFIKFKNGRIKCDYTYMGEYEPQYFVLAEKIGQIKTADRELIPTKTGFNMTKERMLMIDFLARHIEFLKSTKGNSKYNNDISYDTIINKCDLLVGIDEGTPKYRQYKKRYRDDIKNILEQYKRDKIIKDYNEYPKDTKVKRGITINI